MKFIKSTVFKIICLILGLAASVALAFSLIASLANIYYDEEDGFNDFKKSKYMSDEITSLYEKLENADKVFNMVTDFNNREFERLKIYKCSDEVLKAESTNDALSEAELEVEAEENAGDSDKADSKKSKDSGKKESEKAKDSGKKGSDGKKKFRAKT